MRSFISLCKHRDVPTWITAVVIVVLLSLASCSSRGPTIAPEPPLRLDSATFALAEGAATIEGSGFLRQRGGDVVSCAGSPVWLAPDTPYFRWISQKPPF